ncbi:CLUMA_CG013493, isoform A [Clunio marinus]|uniref:CLUMA_CG013493, isoform A n=1 Tax=Clunio marinus TaxID=568069 RepID=A0A1J1IJ17_9DIPT|nr:CLUMA_CG013493, isoform A [Clunio marinus]
MNVNRYLANIIQTNGCRMWRNPNANPNIPESSLELFIKNIPQNLFEADILPHFERFGPIYEFRLMIDYNNKNRGFGYLKYVWDKSALQVLDCMGYFFIRRERQLTKLEVEESQQRSHLLALNIPSYKSDTEIEESFKKLYANLESISVDRENPRNPRNEQSTCSAFLNFPNHQAALAVKRASGTGLTIMWNRNIKILWPSAEDCEKFKMKSKDVKHVLVHNVPFHLDADGFGSMISEFVRPEKIISIRTYRTHFLLEFSKSKAAFEICAKMHGKKIFNQNISTELITYEHFKSVPIFADFDFELRCMCFANYWDPPIFIYGLIIPDTNTQQVAVIIKNNCKNLHVTFLIEVKFENLIEIHSRVCEVILFFLLEWKQLPKFNTVIKCSDDWAVVVGFIKNMEFPSLQPSFLMHQEPTSIYLNDIFNLSRMCFHFITHANIDEVYLEYKACLRNFSREFLCGIYYGDFILGCVDPKYRKGKALKYLMNSRNMILAMCYCDTRSNVNYKHNPLLFNVDNIGETEHSTWNFKLKSEKVELLPLGYTQVQSVHDVERKCIEFNMIDEYKFRPVSDQSRLNLAVPQPFGVPQVPPQPLWNN